MKLTSLFLFAILVNILFGLKPGNVCRAEGLAARIELEDTLLVGETVQFTLSLTNNSDQPIQVPKLSRGLRTDAIQVDVLDSKDVHIGKISDHMDIYWDRDGNYHHGGFRILVPLKPIRQ